MGPAPIEDLITAFARLPGIGRKTAQRLAFHVARQPREEAEALAAALEGVKDRIHSCRECFNYAESGSELCSVCSNPGRDHCFVCVVEDPVSVLVMEANQLLSGVYHVLGGVLSPLDGVGPEDLHIRELVERVKREEVREVVLALNASTEGDATSEYLARLLTPLTQVTRLARGLPVGADLDLADRVTLTHALQGRRSL